MRIDKTRGVGQGELRGIVTHCGEQGDLDSRRCCHGRETAAKFGPAQANSRLSPTRAPTAPRSNRVPRSPSYDHKCGRACDAHLYRRRGLSTRLLTAPACSRGHLRTGATLKVEAQNGVGGEGPAWHPKLGVLTSGNGHVNQLDLNGKWRHPAFTSIIVFLICRVAAIVHQGS